MLRIHLKVPAASTVHKSSFWCFIVSPRNRIRALIYLTESDPGPLSRQVVFQGQPSNKAGSLCAHLNISK